MKLVKPSFEIYEQGPGLEGIYEAIERAGRTCYKSTRPEGQTAKNFVDRMIKSGHNSMLEHGTVYLQAKTEFVNLYIHPEDGEEEEINPLSKYYDNLYSSVDWYIDKNNIQYLCVSTNFRVLLENNWLDDLKYLCEPTEFHEKRVTVRFTTSNGIMREFTRHRSHSFAVESTRYCNYSRDKFNNEITFIKPSWMDETSFDNVQYYLQGQGYDMSFGSINLVNTLSQCEACYLDMIKGGMEPQEAREVLPLATKCDMVMTGFVSDWEHLFRLRTSLIAETGKPHPDMAALCDPLYKEFIEKWFIHEIKESVE